MKIYHKLTLGFLGSSLLVGVVGYIAFKSNESIHYDVLLINKSTIDAFSSNTEMVIALQKIQLDVRKISEVELNENLTNKLQKNIKQEIDNFEDRLLAAKTANANAIEIAQQKKSKEDKLNEALTNSILLSKIAAVFREEKKHLLQNLSNKQLNKERNFSLAEQVESNFNQELIPLISELKNAAKIEIQTKTEATEISIEAISKIIAISTFYAGIAAIFLGFMVADSIAKPITKLKNAATKIGGGKLNTKVNIKSRDEIGTLATAFNQMVEGLSKTTVSKSYLDNILSSMSDTLIVIDIDHQITNVNQATINLLGYEESELLGKPINLLFTEDSGLGIPSLVQNGFIGSVELSYLKKNGSKIPVSFSASLMRDEEGKGQKIVCVARDITERKRAEAKLRHDALHDALTGLPNRVLFTARLEQVIKLKKFGDDYLFAVLFIDLDRFKLINDSLGHLAGDQLLIAIVARIKACLRSEDTIARLGGDEFTVLLEDVKDKSDVTNAAERVQQALKLPFNLNGHEVFTTASIGIVMGTGDYNRPEDFLRNADIAMYHAKFMGKARHEVFDPDMHDRAVARLQLENDLRRAIERQEFQIYYQPIVSLKTCSIDGFEALVRWQHPERGMISPTEFIPIAEETGLIVRLGYWVLREACRQMSVWQQSNRNHSLTISVNLSTKQFSQPDLIQQVEAILRETSLNACSLKLEITESVLMENPESVAAMLMQLRSLGIRLHIDDFGTGYSSLSYLQRFPVDALKIDRCFVSKMGVNGENSEIVQTITMMAQSLGMEVVAEGVETEEHLTQLKTLKCDYGQGYFFSKPVDSEVAETLIAKPIPWIKEFNTPLFCH